MRTPAKANMFSIGTRTGVGWGAGSGSEQPTMAEEPYSSCLECVQKATCERYTTTCLTRTDLDATFVRLFFVAEVALSPNAVQTHVGGLHLLGLLKVRLLNTQIQNHTV